MESHGLCRWGWKLWAAALQDSVSLLGSAHRTPACFWPGAMGTLRPSLPLRGSRGHLLMKLNLRVGRQQAVLVTQIPRARGSRQPGWPHCTLAGFLSTLTLRTRLQ